MTILVALAALGRRRGLTALAKRLFTGDRDLGPSVVCLDLDDFKLVNDRHRTAGTHSPA